MPKRPLSLVLLSSSLLSTAFVVLQGIPAEASTVLQDGIRQFQAGRWVLAQGPLERAASKNPRDLSAHYYLANTYVHLNRHEDAIREYETAYRIDPYGPLSGYCRRALIGYGRPIPGEMVAVGAPGPKPSSISGVRTIASTLPAISGSQIAVGPGAGVPLKYNSSDSISKAVDTIRKQAGVEKGRQKSSSDVLASDAIKTGDASARKIIEDADIECRHIAEAPLPVFISSGGSTIAAEHAREMERRQQLIAEIRKKAENDAARVRAEAQEKSLRYQAFSRDRQAALDEVADSLESQLSNSRVKDRVKLRAEGTGLYVRNFGVLPDAAPDVHNSVARIHPHEEPSHAQEPLVEGDDDGNREKLARDDKGDSATDAGGLNVPPPVKPPVRSVSGKVLDSTNGPN